MKHKRRRSPLRRLLRGVLWLVIVLAVANLAAAYAPFAALPALDAESARAVEARAEEMQRDVDTPDRAAILETAGEALDERIRLMARAREEIILTTYECHDGESTRDILAVALHMAKQGVRVRFLVDGIAGRLDHMDEDLFRAAAIHPNVEVRFYNLIRHWTPWKHMGRMHDKYVIVDDLAYILGGRNMFDKFLGDYPAPVRSDDREALIYNAAHDSPAGDASSLHRLRDYFEGMWAHDDTTVFQAHTYITEARREAVYQELEARYDALLSARPELFDDHDYAAATEQTRGVWLVSGPTSIYAKRPVVFATLCALMRRAERDVVIHSPYAVLNRAMREALASITGGVPVTLMVNGIGTGANVAAGSDYLYHRDGVLSTGVSLLEKCRGDSYHGKAVAIDDCLSVIGCFNLDIRSAWVDTELMLVIRSEAVNARLRRNMAALHESCREVTGDDPVIAADARLPWWKLAAMYALGALMQPVRNLV